MTQLSFVDRSVSTAEREPRQLPPAEHPVTGRTIDEAGFCSLVAAVLECHRCSLLVAESDGYLSLADAVGLPRDIAPRIRVRVGDRVAGRVAQTGKPWIVNQPLDKSMVAAPVAKYRSSSFVSFPFKLPGGNVGVINATERESAEPFGDKDVEVLQRLSAFYAASVHSREKGESPSALAAARQLRKREIRIQELERQRIARDLHDDAGHSIAAAMLRLDRVANLCSDAPAIRRELEVVRELLQECADGLHEVAFQLRPQILGDLGLVPAIRALARRAQDAAGIQINVFSRSAIPRLGETTELAAYRVAQEGLTNALKHARASNVDITVWQTNEYLVLTVADNGIGFDPGAVDFSTGEHIGLKGIRDRAEMVGGTTEVESTLGMGTTIRAQFPIGEVTS